MRRPAGGEGHCQGTAERSLSSGGGLDQDLTSHVRRGWAGQVASGALRAPTAPGRGARGWGRGGGAAVLAARGRPVAGGAVGARRRGAWPARSWCASRRASRRSTALRVTAGRGLPAARAGRTAASCAAGWSYRGHGGHGGLSGHGGGPRPTRRSRRRQRPRCGRAADRRRRTAARSAAGVHGAAARATRALDRPRRRPGRAGRPGQARGSRATGGLGGNARLASPPGPLAPCSPRPRAGRGRRLDQQLRLWPGRRHAWWRRGASQGGHPRRDAHARPRPGRQGCQQPPTRKVQVPLRLECGAVGAVAALQPTPGVARPRARPGGQASAKLIRTGSAPACHCAELSQCPQNSC